RHGVRTPTWTRSAHGMEQQDVQRPRKTAVTNDGAKTWRSPNTTSDFHARRVVRFQRLKASSGWSRVRRSCDLETLRDGAEQRNRWTFLVSTALIPVNGGTGSPLNSIATC